MWGTGIGVKPYFQTRTDSRAWFQPTLCRGRLRFQRKLRVCHLPCVPLEAFTYLFSAWGLKGARLFSKDELPTPLVLLASWSVIPCRSVDSNRCCCHARPRQIGHVTHLLSTWRSFWSVGGGMECDEEQPQIPHCVSG